MLNIKELTDCEKGNEIIIIAGGQSVNSWIKTYTRKKNQKIMTVNFFHELYLTPDYNVFQDGIYKQLIEDGSIYIPDTTVLISLKEQATFRCNYYFIQNEIIIPGTHTGFVALQIVEKILNPDKIFLIGFDYYQENNKIHYYDTYFNEFDEVKRLRYRSAFEGMLNDFKKVKFNTEKIVNLNPKSILIL